MTRAMKAAAKAGVSGALILAAIGLLLAGFVFTQRPMAMADPEPAPPTGLEVATALARVGVGPLTLAAAGVTEESAALLIADMHEYLGEHDGSPASEDAVLGAARSQRDRLRGLARAGTASGADIEAIAGAESSLSAAESALDARLDAMWDLVAARLTSEQAALIARLRDVPEVFRGSVISVEFGAAERSDTQWMALREALAAERLAAEDGVAMDQALAALLASARAESAVNAAGSNISVRLAGLQTAWDQALASFD